MKKFKLDKSASQKIIALTLATTISTVALSGCNSKNQTKNRPLEKTIIGNARVITFEDGHIDIAVENNIRYRVVYGLPNNHNHDHYRSIITGENFTSTECTFDHEFINYKYNITNDESIVAYLTEEEIAKAVTEGLTNEDVKNIILRIFREHEESKQSPTR